MYSLQVVDVSMDMFIRRIDLTSISTILDIGFWICSGGAVILFFHFIPDKGTFFYHIFFTVHAHLSYGGCEQSGQIRTCNRNNMCLCFKVSYAMVNEIWNGKTDTWNLNFQSVYIFCMMFFLQRHLPGYLNVTFQAPVTYPNIVEEARYFSFGNLKMFLDYEKNFRRNKTGHFSWSYFLKQHTETIGMTMGFNSLDIVYLDFEIRLLN